MFYLWFLFMGQSPLALLRKSYEWVQDLSQLETKHHNLITRYERELSGVLRYMFHGFIVPLEIQDAVVILRRNLHTLAAWEELHLPWNVPASIKVITVTNSKNHHTVRFINTTGNLEEIRFTLENDPSRWDFPITEIHRKNKTYRSVPFHGDVRNHLHHQHDFYREEYLEFLLQSWLINPNDAIVMQLFHQIHDLPEIVKWDIHVNDKWSSDAEDESAVIRQLLQDSGILYTPAEIDFVAQLFRVFEQPSNYFKWWERLNYILDALRAYRAGQHFFNGHTDMIGNILGNQLPYFYDEKMVWITPLEWKPLQVPFKELPSTIPFLKKYGQEIWNVLATAAYTDINRHRDKVVTVHNL